MIGFIFFYIFYHPSSVNIDANEGFLSGGNDPVLTVLSAGHALHVFVNGQLSGGCIFLFEGVLGPFLLCTREYYRSLYPFFFLVIRYLMTCTACHKLSHPSFFVLFVLKHSLFWQEPPLGV